MPRRRRLAQEARDAEYMQRAKELALQARDGAKMDAAIIWLDEVYPGWRVNSFEISNPLPGTGEDYKVVVTMKRRHERFTITGRGNSPTAAIISSVYDGVPIDMDNPDGLMTS